MKRLELDSRSQNILRQAVHTFIVAGEPVGSRTLSKVSRYDLSPATIRNIMSDLEELGYLYQPHTSAGRVPTDKGYRFYVGTVMKSTRLTRSERAMIGSRMRQIEGDLDSLMQVSSHLLAQLTDTVSFVIAPDFKKSGLRHIDFVRLAPRRILAVLVSDAGQLTSRVVDAQEDFGQPELQRSARFLEAEFSGLTLAEARQRLEEKVREERAAYDQLVRNALTLGREAFVEDLGPADVYLEGAARMLSKPEFTSNLERARKLLATLEEKSRLVAILNACLEGKGVEIVIGSEAPVPDLQGLALIAARYRCRNRELGSLGIMGPTRMEYAKFISVVDYIARSLSEAIG